MGEDTHELALTGSGSLDARPAENDQSFIGYGATGGGPVSFRLGALKAQNSGQPSQKERSVYSGQRWGAATNTLSKKSATIKEGHTHARTCDHLRMERMYKLMNAMAKADTVSKVLMIAIE